MCNATVSQELERSCDIQKAGTSILHVQPARLSLMRMCVLTGVCGLWCKVQFKSDQFTIY